MTMLDRMRRHKGWLKWSLALVVLTFVVFYIPEFLGPGRTVAPGDRLASVDARSISVNDFRRRYMAQVQAYRAVFEAFAGRIGSQNHLFTVPQPIVGYLALNTERPLFRDNPELRRAINYALDRPALARAFGIRGARATDQYLPPGFPGYRDADLYPRPRGGSRAVT